MERKRRSDPMIAGDREARSIASTLGRETRSTRRRMRMRQADLAAQVGLKQSRISAIERGTGTGAPLVVWARIGAALGRPIAVAFSRHLEPIEPADAGHLDAQELVLRLARGTGRSATFELPTRPESPSSSVDVCIRDDPNRTLILNEIWNRFDDIGKATRTSDKKVAEAAALAAVIGGDRPYRVALCWLFVDNAANRTVIARYPEVIASRFPASSQRWVRALTEGGPVPAQPGVAWVDLRAGRLVPVRRRSA